MNRARRLAHRRSRIRGCGCAVTERRPLSGVRPPKVRRQQYSPEPGTALRAACCQRPRGRSPQAALTRSPPLLAARRGTSRGTAHQRNRARHAQRDEPRDLFGHLFLLVARERDRCAVVLERRPRSPDRRNHWTGTAVEQVLHDHHRVIALLDGLPVEAPRELADRLMVLVIGKTKLSDQKLRDLIKHSNKHRLLDEDFEFPDIRSGPRVSHRRVRRLGGQERRRVLHAARRRSPDGRADQAARGDACLRPCVGSGGMLIHGRH